MEIAISQARDFLRGLFFIDLQASWGDEMEHIERVLR